MIGLPALVTVLLTSGAIAQAQSQALKPPVPGAPAGMTAFVSVNVVPMDTERVLTNQTVLVTAGRITTLGPASEVKVPYSAVRIDGQGKYLMPGLGDCHVHISGGWSLFGSPPRVTGLSGDSVAERRLFTWLTDGITMIRNLDYTDKGLQHWKLDGPALLRLRARVAAGELWSPRIYTAGQWAPPRYILSNHYRQKPDSAPRLDSVAGYVAAYKAAGYDFLKIHEESPEVFTAVLAAARQAGLPVVGHVKRDMLEQALANGMHSIEHLEGYKDIRDSLGADRRQVLSQSTYRKLIEATRRAGTWNCVTMQVGDVRKTGQVNTKQQFFRGLRAGGAGLLLGSDEPLGLGVHYELLLLVKEEGLTPYEALAMGTKHMAASLLTLDESGTVTVGKRADLVLLTGNPLADVRYARRPAGVMIGGRWLSRAAMDRRLAAFAATGGAELYVREMGALLNQQTRKDWSE